MTLSAADLAAFVDEDMPGYALSTIGGTDVAVLFKDNYSEVLGMSGSQPAAVAVTDDLPAITIGVTNVVINSVTYTVEVAQGSPADLGPGMTRLLLRET